MVFLFSLHIYFIFLHILSKMIIDNCTLKCEIIVKKNKYTHIINMYFIYCLYINFYIFYVNVKLY